MCVEFFSINKVVCEIEELQGGRWSVGVLWCPRSRAWDPEVRFKREEHKLAVALSLDELLTKTFDAERFCGIAEAIGAASRDPQERANVLAARLSERGELAIIRNQVGSSGYDVRLTAELPVEAWIRSKPPVGIELFGFSTGFLQRGKHRRSRKKLPRWHERRLAADRDERVSQE